MSQRDRSEVVLGLHDFDDFENGGQPEVYDIEQYIRVNINNPFKCLLCNPYDDCKYNSITLQEI